EYYTGICFQFLSPQGDKIGGGGRYDDLIPMMGGPDLPSCGFALYIDQIVDMLAEADLRQPQIAVVSIDDDQDTVRRCLAMAQAVRGRGVGVVVCAGAKPAEHGHCRWIVEVRADRSDSVLVTDRETNEASTYSIPEALDRLIT
ncbi:MAG: ATP phosphoribosyltransferase regulatory subunit, partial [Chloroflexota bacterium]